MNRQQTQDTLLWGCIYRTLLQDFLLCYTSPVNLPGMAQGVWSNSTSALAMHKAVSKRAHSRERGSPTLAEQL